MMEVSELFSSLQKSVSVLVVILLVSKARPLKPPEVVVVALGVIVPVAGESVTDPEVTRMSEVPLRWPLI